MSSGAITGCRIAYYPHPLGRDCANGHDVEDRQISEEASISKGAQVDGERYLKALKYCSWTVRRSAYRPIMLDSALHAESSRILRPIIFLTSTILGLLASASENIS